MVSAKGNYIAALTESGRVYLFDNIDNVPIWVFETNEFSGVVAISLSENRIAVGTFQGKIYMLPRAENVPIWSYKSETPIFSVQISWDDNMVVVGASGNLYLFRGTDNIPLWKFQVAESFGQTSISRDHLIVAGAHAGAYPTMVAKIFHFKPQDTNPLWSYTTDTAVWAVDISSDGRFIVAGDLDGRARLFSPSDNIPLWTYQTEYSGAYGYYSAIYSVAISENGDHIAFGAFDNKVYFSTRQGRIYELPQENSLLNGLYYWRIVATDKAGNETPSESRWLIVDTVQPPKPILRKVMGVLKDNNTPIFDWFGIANESGIVYDFQLDDDNLYITPLISYEGMISSEAQPLLQLPDGLYSWRVRGRDRAGNVGEWSENTFIIDTQPPLPENDYLLIRVFEENENLREDRIIFSSTVGRINDNTPRLWIVIFDKGTGIVENFRLWFDNENTFTGAILLATENTYIENREDTRLKIKIENFIGTGLVENLIYYVKLQAWDNILSEYGGPHYSEILWRFIVDITPPAEAPQWLENTWHNDNTPTFRWGEIQDADNEKVWQYHIQ
ncbi:MAG: PQQ-binding-like beta-propeller repeat protein, partial [Candidatus Hadarchaeales archaeon]